jgi:DNA-binding transcriptional regulator YdaS (Cro superfamily)
MNTEQKKQAYQALVKAIELAGGQKAFAAICGAKVRQGHVFNWLTRNKNYLPCEYVLTVEKALNYQVKRYELRPDIYPPEEYNNETLRKP